MRGDRGQGTEKAGIGNREQGTENRLELPPELKPDACSSLNAGLKACSTLLILALVLSGLAAAQGTLSGTVTNGTTGKPAANAEVTLLALTQGMQEAGKTKTDASGKYTLKLAEAGPHLVRVSFQDVNYNKMAPPGMATADIKVYEATKKADNIALNVETAYQSESGKLQAVQFYTVRNASNPPRTQAGDHAFVIMLPEGAEIDAARVQAPGGQPIEQAPTATGKKGEYAFSYPVRPGETMFQIGYHLSYSGELSVTPKVNYPLNQFALVLPQGMTFEPKSGSTWETPEHQAGITLKVASKAEGKDLTYRISGEGQLPDQQADAQGGAGAEANGAPRPGGGIGAPIDAPDPLSRFRWPLLTMLSGLLALGALFMVSRRGLPTPSPTKVRSALMEELKEQLFELELDRRQGRISHEQYTANKAALDATMERALAKKSSS